METPIATAYKAGIDHEGNWIKGQVDWELVEVDPPEFTLKFIGLETTGSGTTIAPELDDEMAAAKKRIADRLDLILKRFLV